MIFIDIANIIFDIHFNITSEKDALIINNCKKLNNLQFLPQISKVIFAILLPICILIRRLFSLSYTLTIELVLSFKNTYFRLLYSRTKQEEDRYFLNKTYTSVSLNFALERIFTYNGTMVFIKTDASLYFYTFLICSLIFLTLLRSFMFFTMAMHASKKLHLKMFHALLQAPMRFFDTNSSGRVLNRFSKDMGAIDEFLPRALLDAVQILLVLSGILTLVLIANCYMIVPLVILGAIFLKLKSLFITTTRNVKNLEGISECC